MNWLKDHVFLATWLALPVALIIAWVNKRKAEGMAFDWFRFIFYFSFLACLGVAFTPQFDVKARTTANDLIYFLLGAIIVYKGGFKN